MHAAKLGLLCLCALFMAISSAAAEEPARVAPQAWPMFRGNASMTGLTAALPAKLERLWNVNLGMPIEATAAIVEGTIYIPTGDGKTFALSLADGKQVWQFPGKDDKSGDLGAVKSSPTVAGNQIIYGDDFGFVRALDRTTGKQQWVFETNDQVISSPIVVDGKVIVGSYDGSLYAIDQATGKQAWTVMTDGPVHTSPTLINGDRVCVAGCDGFMRLIAVADGKELGSLELGGNIASTAALVGDRIYLGLLDEPAVAINWANPAITWTFKPRRPLGFYSSPAVTDQWVIIGCRDKNVYGINRADGEKVWSFATRGKVDSSPVIAGDFAYVGSVDGNLYGLKAATGENVWEYTIGSPVVASPAIADGRLVIGDQDGVLHCFGAK